MESKVKMTLGEGYKPCIKVQQIPSEDERDLLVAGFKEQLMHKSKTACIEFLDEPTANYATYLIKPVEDEILYFEKRLHEIYVANNCDDEIWHILNPLIEYRRKRETYVGGLAIQRTEDLEITASKNESKP